MDVPQKQQNLKKKRRTTLFTKGILYQFLYLSEYTKEYSQFIKDYIAAIKNDDSKKIKQLKKQSLELTEKAKVISQKLKSHTEIEKFNKWLATQNKKIEILKEQN